MKGIYAGCPMQITHVFPRGAKRLARIPKLSREATVRLRWFDYYRKSQNASLTCRYFGISRKTFYKWKKRYNRWDLITLETRSRAPRRRRKRMIPFEKELRIKALRKKYIRYGKEKLKVLYEKIYPDKVTTWQIQKTIEKYNLYYHPIKNEKLRRKRKLSQKKKRITELKNKTITGFFFQVDTISLFRSGLKRYIFTAIDKTSKLAFSRMYKAASSLNARDFFYRLLYLVDTKIEIIQTDNGSEFAKLFEEACTKLKVPHYFSRVKMPKDNAINERFNRTLKEEFIQLGNFTPEPLLFNQRLTEWLIEYDFNRPHQSLDYLSHIEYLNNYQKVLPMLPSSTYSVNAK